MWITKSGVYPRPLTWLIASVKVPVTFALAVPVEADVAVADLGEAQGRSGLGVRRAGGAGDMGDHFAAGDGQPDRRAEPRGMADQLPAGHAPRIALGGHLVTTTVPCMNGWIEQM